MSDFTPRTVQQIESAILADVATRPALQAIDTTSNASVFRHLVQAFAVAINLHENAFAGFRAEIEERATTLQVGSEFWYAAESLVFQLGDPLIFVNGFATYEVIDESKRIVKLASSDKVGDRLIIKVAALDSAGLVVPLSNAELSAFQQYWDLKKFACTPIQIVSIDADTSRITYRIGVDPTVIDPATGALLTDSNVFPVENAINTFLQEFQASRFNSFMRVVELTDAIQAVAGVLNPVVEDVQCKSVSDTQFTDVLANQNEEYLALSGYIINDTTQGNRLRDTLSYYDAIQ